MRKRIYNRERKCRCRLAVWRQLPKPFSARAVQHDCKACKFAEGSRTRETAISRHTRVDRKFHMQVSPSGMAAASQAVPGEFDSRHLLHQTWLKKISRRKKIANAVFFLVFRAKSPRFCIFRNIQIHENDLRFRRYFYNCHRVELKQRVLLSSIYLFNLIIFKKMSKLVLTNDDNGYIIE